jgi:hypothetical protein
VALPDVPRVALAFYPFYKNAAIYGNQKYKKNQRNRVKKFPEPRYPYHYGGSMSTRCSVITKEPDHTD